ncbi:MAG: hypothetical protein FWG05_05340 [Kiritimatiellaeota bacterium]|nr:hypothetical protein [Kiritimatiellota bacterium]
MQPPRPVQPPPQVQPVRPAQPPPQPIFTQPKPAPKPAPQPGPRVAQPVPQPVFNPPYKIPNYTLQSHNAPVFVPHSSLFTTHAAFITPRAPYLSYYSGGGYYFIPYDNIYAITPSSSYAGNYAMPADTLPQNSVWIGQFLTTDEAKEIAVPEYVYNKICIELVSGTVSLNTVWLRPEKTEVRVASRLQPGEILTIDLGNAPRAINGLRISDNGRGVYRIYGL